MKRRRKAAKVNSGAIADVSFLLLIFFMVVTTFNKDFKLEMKLPPESEEKVKSPIAKDRVLEILINGNNEIMVDEKVVQNVSQLKLTDELYKICQKKKEGVVLLRIHEDSNYESYVRALAAVQTAKNDLRTLLAKQNFKVPYLKLNNEQRKMIEGKIRFRISEHKMGVS